MADLIRRVGLIVGGSGGIGSAVSRRLAEDGVRCVIGFHRSRDAAETTAREIRAAGFWAEPAHLDVTVPGEAEKVCERVYAREGRLDILVNCAAVNREAPALGMEDGPWAEVLEANLAGSFRACRAAARFMLLNRWGRVVNLSSVAARLGGRGQVGYAASKSGVEAMTRVLALELGRKGILVNCVAPGIIETAMSRRIRDEHGDELRKAIAVSRFGETREVAAVVAFLASDAASYVTGQVVRVDGGMGL